METVTEETQCVVGKFYLVPCAKMIRKADLEIYYEPVHGPPHNDKAFGFDYKHYHVDGRFSDKVDALGRTNAVMETDPREENKYYHYVSEIVLLKKKCKRLTTGINPPDVATKFWNWYKSMEGKSCAGKKCPHLGVTMHERGGKLVCPLHGLIGSLESETIIAGPPPMIRKHFPAECLT